MRVSSKMMINTFLYNLTKNETVISQKMEQVSSGKRIKLPSDDPSGAARSMALNSSLLEVKQYTTNSQAATSWLNTTDDALATVSQNLQRAYELVISGASGDKPSSARAAIAEEIDQIRDGLLQVANTTIDDRYIFAGEEVLNPAYSLRTPVTGDTRDLSLNQIRIDLGNNEFKVKLDDNTIKNISLTPKVYDGSPGKTLDDLAADAQAQLEAAGFEIPVFVKASESGQLTFYAGTKPDDGKTHTLVLKEGVPLKATGYARLPVPALADNQLQLANDTNVLDDFYQGWNVTITSGKGVGQIRQITDYNGTDKVITTDASWGIIPDANSTYSIKPPLAGRATGATVNTMSFNATNSSGIDDFYNGMQITVTNGAGAGETKRIVGYDGNTHTATLDSGWGTIPASSNYIITPHQEGTVQTAPAMNQLSLDATLSSQIDDFYVGTTITVKNINGSSETRMITDYDGVTRTATVDQDWLATPSATSTYRLADTALAQMGFSNQATTKELVGSVLNEPILVIGKYPLTGIVPNTTAANELQLAKDVSSVDHFYQNWQVSIISGTGAGQKLTVNDYDGATQRLTVNSNWAVEPDATSQYALTPPLEGMAQTDSTLAKNQIKLDLSASASDNFYQEMPITITEGNGVGQTRKIIAYDAVTKIATLDSIWNNLPNSTSKYTIDANYYVNDSNKFKITVGRNPPQEISVDGGTYTTVELAKQLETKIQARGGDYANVRVLSTPEQKLRVFYRDPDLGDNDQPLSLRLESGSSADLLGRIGFNAGVSSDLPQPTYEGDFGGNNYEVNISTRIQVNTIGQNIFDPIFEHLNKISQDLRTGDTKALSNIDIRNVKQDLDQVLLAQGECGAKVKRLENGISRLDILQVNFETLLSNVEDTDLPQTLMELKIRQFAYDSALQIGAKIIPTTLLDYLR